MASGIKFDSGSADLRHSSTTKSREKEKDSTPYRRAKQFYMNRYNVLAQGTQFQRFWGSCQHLLVSFMTLISYYENYFTAAGVRDLSENNEEQNADSRKRWQRSCHELFTITSSRPRCTTIFVQKRDKFTSQTIANARICSTCIRLCSCTRVRKDMLLLV